MEGRNWRSEPLPARAISVVRAELSGLVGGIVEAVRAEHPGYAEVLGGPDGIGLRLGIEQAIRAFLDTAERGERPVRVSEATEVWRRLGEAEFQQGRDLEALRRAFRTGTRAAWRGAAELAAAADVPAPLVIGLAEAIFVFTDELSADVVAGYLRAQSDAAGERERRRRRLAALLLDAEAHDPEALERAAGLAGWPVPRRLAVLAIAADSPGLLTRGLDVEVLAGGDADGAWLIVPDPDGPGRRRALERAVAGAAALAALGPAVAPAQARRSLAWARATLTLLARGVIESGGPVRADEHLAALIVMGDPELARALAARRLGPLDGLGAAERARLLETLAAWLDLQRHTPAIAATLGVHPQTVRYRLRRLGELLGEALETPEGRFELALALRARAGLAASQAG
jgi:hypothetical protein